MDEQKNIPSPQQEARKPYEPPTAEIILLTPKEELAGWSYDYHDSNRWGLGGWAAFNSADSLDSGFTGTVVPADDSWTLPTK